MYADAHCDTLTKAYDEGCPLYKNNCRLDFSRLKQNGCILQFMAIWTKPEYTPDDAYRRCLSVLDFYYKSIKGDINTVISPQNICSDKLNILLSVEGGSILNGDIKRLYTLYKKGIRAITLTWNDDNCISGGIENDRTGLTPFGREVVKEMHNLGMIVDVSHISQKGFWDTAEISDYVFASHSNCKSVCNHKRNLTDGQIKCIIEKDGFIGINFYSDFLNKNGATLDDIKRHKDHILSLGGERVIGMGSDFDGMDKLPDGIKGAENMPKIADIFCKKDMLYGNIYRNIVRILKN